MNGLTRHQVAEILGVCDQTVSNYCKEGLLGSWRGKGNVLYVNAEDVEKYKVQLRMIAASEELIRSKQRSLDEERKRIDSEDAMLRLALRCEKPGHYGEWICSLIHNLVESGIIPFFSPVESSVLCEFIAGSNTVEMAKMRGLTPERIRQILSKAISRFSDVPDMSVRWRNYHEIMEENTILRTKNEMLRKQLYPMSHYEMSDYVSALLNTKIVDLDVSVRSLNILYNFKDGNGAYRKIETVGDLVMCPGGEEEILNQRNCGRKTLLEITDLIKSLGLSFMRKDENEIDFYRRLEREIEERRGE